MLAIYWTDLTVYSGQQTWYHLYNATAPVTMDLWTEMRKYWPRRLGGPLASIILDVGRKLAFLHVTAQTVGSLTVQIAIVWNARDTFASLRFLNISLTPCAARFFRCRVLGFERPKEAVLRRPFRKYFANS